MQSKLTLQTALDLFLLDCTARRLTIGTQSFYKAKLSPFIRWCEAKGVTGLEDMQAVHIRQYLSSILERNLTAQYQNNIARAIRAWLNYCVRDELIPKSPFDRVKMPKLAKKILPAFSQEDIKNILRVCRTKREEAICLTLLDSGVRATELVTLNVNDLNMKSGTLIVRAGKGQKDRTTYVGARTRKAILRYLAERGSPAATEPLFISHHNERLTLSGIVQIMRRLRKRSGVAHCAAHTFRRTFAIKSLRNGMNVHVLAQLMGHADIQMLRKYLDITEEDLKASADKHGVVDNMT